MDQSLEVPNIETKPTDSKSSDQVEISNEMKSNCFKQEGDYLVQSAIYINTEPQQNKSELPVITSTSYKICYYDDIKVEIEEAMIKIECEDLVDEIIQDPLYVGDKIKVEERCPIDVKSKSRIKTEPTEGEIDENILKSDENSDSHESKSILRDQLLIMNNQDCKDKKYICNECNKTFGWKGNLDRHLRIHTGEKPYICDVCGKSFNVKGNLDNHMLVHSGEKPHICDICKKVFTQKAHLDSHKLIHGGKKQFSCDECDKSFLHKHHLVVHTRIHTNNKPYVCDLCEKSFTLKLTLVKHKRLHTGEKPFSCDVCSKSFTQKSTLNRHKKIHINS